MQFPAQHICCGRPLYDFGFLDQARTYLQKILERLGPQIDAGMPFVILEPSCASVFRDELTNFFPTNERALRLAKQTFLLSEFLSRHAPDYRPPQLNNRKMVVHGHCHHKALMGMQDELALLQATNAQVSMLDSGCCGMAGPFGFEKDKYEVSQALGERFLCPQCARLPRKRSWSRMASAAGNRYDRTRHAMPFIWLRFWPGGVDWESNGRGYAPSLSAQVRLGESGARPRGTSWSLDDFTGCGKNALHEGHGFSRAVKVLRGGGF